MVEKCIAAAQNVKRNRGFPNNNVVIAAIGSIAQPVEKKFQPIPFSPVPVVEQHYANVMSRIRCRILLVLLCVNYVVLSAV